MTPNMDQESSTASESPTTQHTTPVYSEDFVSHTQVLVNLGYHNKNNMFVTYVGGDGGFLAHYAPTKIEDSKVQECLDNLCDREQPVLERTDAGYKWICFPDYFLKPLKDKPDEPLTLEQRKMQQEDNNFRPVKTLIDAILETKKEGLQDYLQFVLCPRSRKQSDIGGGNHMMDGAFTDETWDGKTIHASAVKIPVEFRNKRSDKDENNQQIFGACHHILSEHPGMMWVYGLVLRVPQNPDTFVHAILSFAHATPAELGVDPLVHKRPISDDGAESTAYVYEVPADTTGGSPVFYKTGRSLVPGRSMRLNGRSTRVWEVTQVTSADGNVEVNPGMKLILKDVWLDHDQATEAENMDQIFEAVDELVTKGLEDQEKAERDKNPGFTLDEAVKPKLLKQFVDGDSRFKDFDAHTKERMVSYFTNQHYRSLFLTKVYAWKGERSKSLGSQVYHLPDLFPNPFITIKSSDHISTSELESPEENAGSFRRETNDPWTPSPSQEFGSLQPGGQTQPSALARKYVRKQQCRFVYGEVCTPVNKLPTLGDAVDVLYQATDALKILYSIGWVHRDISTGNILALRTSSGWAVKLSDLEFSRPMVDEKREASSDSRTGTPFFMPIEISTNKHLFEPWRGAPVPWKPNLAQSLGKGSDPNFEPLTQFQVIPYSPQEFEIPGNYDFSKIPLDGVSVNHNYQHDLESIWWILLWLLTMCASHNGETYVGPIDWSSIFERDLKKYEHRALLFEHSVHVKLAKLVEPLQQKFPLWMETLRDAMFMNYVVRALFGQIDMQEAYVGIHKQFSNILEQMHLDGGDWRQVKLVHSESAVDLPPGLAPSSPPPPPAPSITRSSTAKRPHSDSEDSFALHPRSNKKIKHGP